MPTFATVILSSHVLSSKLVKKAVDLHDGHQEILTFHFQTVSLGPVPFTQYFLSKNRMTSPYCPVLDLELN